MCSIITRSVVLFFVIETKNAIDRGYLLQIIAVPV